MTTIAGERSVQDPARAGFCAFETLEGRRFEIQGLFDYLDNEIMIFPATRMALFNVTETDPVILEIDDTDVKSQEPAKVILYNDNIHTFDEVIGQLIKAIGCATSRAEALAWEVHTRGKAIVYDGPMNECIRVSAVLEEIALLTQIEV